MRINGITVDSPREGRFYLLRRSPVRGSDSYVLSESPGRTNRSHTELYEGWLGTTNDVAYYAEQAIEIRRRADGAGWRYRLIPAQDLVVDDEATQVESF